MGNASYTVAEAVEDWLRYGLTTQSAATLAKLSTLCRLHVVPSLGRRRLRELSAAEVDRWLSKEATTLGTNTLSQLHSALNRSVKRAMARDLVSRNVVELVEIPRGRTGRRSKSLTLAQVEAVLTETRGDRMHAYIVAALLTGARTEELRALRWDHVHMDDEPAFVEVWRSVRVGGDTKTRKSRRTLALPRMCREVLREHRVLQAVEREVAGRSWEDSGLVFTTRRGTSMDAANVRRDFRKALDAVPGVNGGEWTPRELRHSFVSVMSHAGVPLEEIARLVGHSGTNVTELIYRHELRPVLQSGATIMDRLFGAQEAGSGVTQNVTQAGNTKAD